MRLIESDFFPFEFLSKLGERESWRKEIHRPIYHVHKWWAKRLGSVFRGILLGCFLDDDSDLRTEFYRTHSFANIAIFDPFMGAGTTVGEAHKLGCIALGRDINPVAVDLVRVALGPLDRPNIESTFCDLSSGVGERIRALYRSTDADGRSCDILYYFWVMQTLCPNCNKSNDLFPSYVIAKNAYPKRRPDIQIVCPKCREIFGGTYGVEDATCPTCSHRFNPLEGVATGANATCPYCAEVYAIAKTVRVSGRRPDFRLYAKLVLTHEGKKQYLRVSEQDLAAYAECQRLLQTEVRQGTIKLPMLKLEEGYNTRQAMGYNFTWWRDFFNDRQLLALGWLQNALLEVGDPSTRDALLTVFSGALEFNNLFASYKGEGTGAVRHMFSHHILKPERTPIEANIWGTPKSSGSFSNLFRARLMRAIDYRLAPTEVNGHGGERGVVCSPPFSGELHPWPEDGHLLTRAISMSCGDSAATGLPDRSIDFIVTDPPFFDNVHYSELADFFYAWWQTGQHADRAATTRHEQEVQDINALEFARKLRGVFAECHRVLKDSGLLVFTYHHSREEGWKSVADAILGSGFVVVNSHPVKSEMSVAIPKSQAREPIQLDIILVCRKRSAVHESATVAKALESAESKITRLLSAGFMLSQSDRRIVGFGQLLTSLADTTDTEQLERALEQVQVEVSRLASHATAPIISHSL